MVSTVDDDGDAARRMEDNLTANDTQPLNSDCSASSSPGENGGYTDDFYMDEKVSFGDTVPIEDIFETQVVNYEDETEVLDDLDFIGCTGTQMVDEFSDQVVLDSDDEGSDTTEVLGTDDDGEPMVEEKVHCSSHDNSKDKQCVDQTNAVSNHQLNSISVPRFTSVQIEAQRNGRKDSGNGFSSKPSNSHSPEQLVSCGQTFKESNTGKTIDKEQEPENGIKSKIDSTTLRRLFTVDSITENVGIGCTSSIIGAKEINQKLTINEELAGLSYVDSQEPGDASQADALAFVERLIDETKISFDGDVSLGNCGGRKSNYIPTSKGPQSLAKNTTKQSIGGKTGIFDWDDRLEDEGGGDIFIRRKVDFFGGKEPGKSFTVPPKGRSNTRKACRGNQRNKGVAVRSDSKTVVQKFKLTEDDNRRILRSTRKNLLEDLHEQADRDESTGQPEATVGPDILDVGLDTQLAADAMESLLNVDPISGCDGTDAKDKHSVQQSFVGKSKRRVSSKQSASSNNYDTGVNTRQSKKRKKNDAISVNQKSVSPHKPSNKLDLERDAGPVSMTRRRVISDDMEHSVSRAKKSIKKPPPRTSEPEIREAGQGIQLDLLNNSEGAVLRRGRSVKRQSSTDVVADHPTIARRTRKSFAASLLAGSGVDANKDHTKEEHRIDQSPAGTIDEEMTSSKSGKSNNLQSKSTATNRTSFPRKRRSERNLSEEPRDHQYNLDHHMGKSHRSSRPRKESKDVTGAEFDTTYGDKILLPEKEVTVTTEKLSKGETHLPTSTPVSPVGSVTTNAASPVCMGNGWSKKNLVASSVRREITNLCSIDPEPISEVKDSRKRRDLADIRVIFSHHLKEDVIKRQKKLADRLKVSVASSILNATHFVTDRFVRTRNMLEAIASGKPVVTPLWLEHVGRANYYIDEQKYILRDAKKEKEIGFNMEVSLAHARQHAFLQGRKVLITENAKPSKEILSGLVKAARGQPIERLGRSALKDDTLTKDLLVLSCDEDYEVCMPLLEKGAAAYGSELLLNGIVTRKLEYDRHRLFMDHVKRTRSTIWLRKDGDKSFTPVLKNK